MKSAEELLKISKEQAPKLVDEILDGVEEHIITRAEEEAMKGSTYYVIHLNKVRSFVEEMLKERCIELAHKFEANGYKVAIDDTGNGYWLNYNITLSWSGSVRHYDGYIHRPDFVYDTDQGAIKR